MRHLHHFVTVLRVIRRPASDRNAEAASERHRQNGRASSAFRQQYVFIPSRSISHAAISTTARKASSVPAPNGRGCLLSGLLLTGWHTVGKLTRTASTR